MRAQAAIAVTIATLTGVFAQTSPKQTGSKSTGSAKSTSGKAVAKSTKSAAASNTAKRTTAAKGGTTAAKGGNRAASTYHPPPQQPTTDRYKEIQQALADRGYFAGAVDGNWGPASSDALKRFQHDQNLVEDGKVGSLSLIALGLGPKRSTLPPPAPAQPPAPQSSPQSSPQTEPQ